MGPPAARCLHTPLRRGPRHSRARHAPLRLPGQRFALLLGWYLTVYLVGIGVISVLDSASDSRAVISVGTVLFTAPLSFIGARYLVGKDRLPGLDEL
jgi:hypothetical protein